MATNNNSALLITLIFIIIVTVPHRAFSSDLPAFVAGAYTRLFIHKLGHAAVAKWYGASDIAVEIPRRLSNTTAGFVLAMGEGTISIVIYLQTGTLMFCQLPCWVIRSGH